MLRKYMRYAREFMTAWYIFALYTIIRSYFVFGSEYTGAVATTFIIATAAYFLVVKGYHWSIYVGACLSIYLLIALLYTLVTWRFFNFVHPWDIELTARFALLLSVPLTGLFIKLVMKRFTMITKRL